MNGSLVLYDAARTAVVAARDVDELKDIRDKAQAMAGYARQAKDTELLGWVTEIKVRAERRAGEMLRDSAANGERASQATGNPQQQVSQPTTLADIGISRDQSSRWQKLAAVSEAQFEQAVAAAKEVAGEVTTAAMLRLNHNHRAQGTGENEWYTPKEYIESARKALVRIELDPASSEIAQKTVKAESYYTKEQNGLDKKWGGRVWLNPPYAQPAIQQFVEKLVAEFTAGNVKEAVLLTHNYTDTEWFHIAASACSLICFTRGRIKFVAADGTIAAPTQGQAFFYYGKRLESFRRAFDTYGFIR